MVSSALAFTIEPYSVDSIFLGTRNIVPKGISDVDRLFRATDGGLECGGENQGRGFALSELTAHKNVLEKWADTCCLDFCSLHARRTVGDQAEMKGLS